MMTIKPAILMVKLKLAYAGAENQMVQLALSLKAKGYRVGVLCFEHSDAHVDILHAAGVSVHVLEKKPGGLLLSLVRYLVEFKTDIVHAHDNYSFFPTTLAAVVLRKKIIFTEHSRHYIDMKLRRRLEKALLARFCSAIVTVSNNLMACSLRKERVPKRKLFYIPNGIELKNFLRATIGSDVPVAQRKVAVVARLFPIKGHAFLLEAISLLKEKLGDHMPRFYLYGDGPEMTNLRVLAQRLDIETHILFEGRTHDVARLLAQKDLFVLPSLSEAMPLALLEGMACGLPVVATSVGGVTDLVKASGGGWLVSPGDPVALAEVLEMALSNGDQLRQFGERNFHYAHDHFSTEEMVNRYESVYQDVCR